MKGLAVVLDRRTERLYLTLYPPAFKIDLTGPLNGP